MLILSIILLCAVLLLTLLLVLKSRELTTGVPVGLLMTLNTKGRMWEDAYGRVLHRLFEILGNATRRLESVAKHVTLVTVSSVRFLLIRWGERTLNAIKGKGAMNKRGAASLYLKNISEYKETLDKNGRIEE